MAVIKRYQTLFHPQGFKTNLIKMKNSVAHQKYTCNEYREEMILLGLQRRLAVKNLSTEEKDKLLVQIKKIEKQMGID